MKLGKKLIGFKYWLIRLFNPISNIPYDIKRFVQRGLRGWSVSDTWSIDWYLSDIIPEMVDTLKLRNFGYPNGLTPMKWRAILTIISTGFRLTRKVQNCEKVTKKEQEVIDRAFYYFKKYYYSLWD